MNTFYVNLPKTFVTQGRVFYPEAGTHTHSYKPVVPQVCSADPKGSATSSQGIRGYISVMATLKFT
jgi:hypothetical protein